MSGPKWISVDERLPEFDQKFNRLEDWTCTKTVAMTDGNIRFAGRFEKFIPEGKSFDFDYESSPYSQDVYCPRPTHWCDCLPELPGRD